MPTCIAKVRLERSGYADTNPRRLWGSVAPARSVDGVFGLDSRWLHKRPHTPRQ